MSCKQRLDYRQFMAWLSTQLEEQQHIWYTPTWCCDNKWWGTKGIQAMPWKHCWINATIIGLKYKCSAHMWSCGSRYACKAPCQMKSQASCPATVLEQCHATGTVNSRHAPFNVYGTNPRGDRPGVPCPVGCPNWMWPHILHRAWLCLRTHCTRRTLHRAHTLHRAWLCGCSALPRNQCSPSGCTACSAAAPCSRRAPRGHRALPACNAAAAGLAQDTQPQGCWRACGAAEP